MVKNNLLIRKGQLQNLQGTPPGICSEEAQTVQLNRHKHLSLY
jgi:hypothetical protein